MRKKDTTPFIMFSPLTYFLPEVFFIIKQIFTGLIKKSVNIAIYSTISDLRKFPIAF